MARLSGKTALVTAAGQGIGKATAEHFAREGARVIATDINAEALASLAKEASAQETLMLETHILDVTDAAAVDALAQSLGRIDVLFNGVGYVHAGTVLDCDEAAWMRSFEINVSSMHRTIRAFLPGILASGGGSIINMSSVASSIKGAPNRYAYGMTKAAVIGLTKAVAADFITQGVRANAICPGTVQTPSLEERLEATGDYEAAYQAFVARQPMGRMGLAKEIAQLAVYLASDESAFTTGTINVIDGGWSN